MMRSPLLASLRLAAPLGAALMLSVTSAHAQPAPAPSAAPPAASSPARLPYTGGPVPKGYRIDSTPSYGLIGIGGAITGIGLMVVIAASSQSPRRCDHQEESCTSASLSDYGSFALGGVVTATGLVTLIAGLASRNKYLVKAPDGTGDTPSDAPTRERQSDRGRVMLQVAPQCGPHQIGLGMVGVF